MKFTEFYNRNKNALVSSSRKKIESSIPLKEERHKFFSGDTFKRDDIVQSGDSKYRVLEKKSNYFILMTENGELVKRFAKDLTILDEEFPSVADLIGKEESDDPVADIKQLKEEKMEDYKSKDKLTVAKIIADAVGIPHDAISSPENLVNQAIRKASKDPALLKNKSLIQNMLQIATDVGIKYTKSVFDTRGVNEETKINEAHKIGTKVKIIGGPKDLHGVEGHIGEIRHGLHKTAAKTYTIYHGESGAIQLKKEHFRKVNEEYEADKVCVDIPLLIRLMEFAREDAKTDEQLHFAAENMIKLGEEGKILSMYDYNSIVGSAMKESMSINAPAGADVTVPKDQMTYKKFKAMQTMLPSATPEQDVPTEMGASAEPEPDKYVPNTPGDSLAPSSETNRRQKIHQVRGD